jgi:hypothetical protein
VLAVAWLVLEALLALASLGLGLLAECVAGTTIAGTLLIPLGLAPSSS